MRSGNEDEDWKKGRKYLCGVGNAIDRFATSAITARKVASLAKMHEDLLEEVGLHLNTKVRDIIGRT